MNRDHVEKFKTARDEFFAMVESKARLAGACMREYAIHPDDLKDTPWFKGR